MTLKYDCLGDPYALSLGDVVGLGDGRVGRIVIIDHLERTFEVDPDWPVERGCVFAPVEAIRA